MVNLRLEAELFMLRHGWLPPAVAALALAAAWLEFFSVPEIRDRIRAQEQELVRWKSASLAMGAAPASLLEERHREFRKHLLPRHALPDALKSVFSHARKNGLVLQQMDYSLSREPGGAYLVYRINAPLQGSYGALRQFMQGILAEMPSVTLEEAAFRRKAIGSPTTEARLRIAIYLKEGDRP